MNVSLGREEMNMILDMLGAAARDNQLHPRESTLARKTYNKLIDTAKKESPLYFGSYGHMS